jgi:tetratricopeptide (TPR) repeat protein
MTAQPLSPGNLAQLQVLADLGRWADVLAHGAALLARGDEPVAFALVLQAHYMQDTLATPAAQSALQRARQIWPGDARWPFFAAHQALALGLLAQAEREARAGLAMQPSAAHLHTCLAQVLAAGHNWADAARALDVAISLAPDEATYHTERARMAHNLQQRQLALKHVHEALRLAPGHANALALLALLQSPAQGLTRWGRARQLLGQALRANPTQTEWQKQWRDLGGRWWLDVALAVLGCVLTLSSQSWAWVKLVVPEGVPVWWPQAVFAFNAVLAFSWLGRVQRVGLLWLFLYAQALCWMADAPTSLPMRWLQSGPAALWDWETLAYVAGSVLVAFIGGAGLGLVRVAGTEPLRLAWVFGREGVKAQREGRGWVWLGDVCSRPTTHFNALVGLLALAVSGPWVALAMVTFWWIFAVPLGVWLLALWRLPKGQRPNGYLVFWLLGMVPAGGLQWLWALGLALYAMLQANSLRQA